MLDIAETPSQCGCCRHYKVEIFPHQCLRCGDMRCKDTAKRWNQQGAKTLEDFVGFIDTAQKAWTAQLSNDHGYWYGSRQRRNIQHAMGELEDYWSMGGLADA